MKRILAVLLAVMLLVAVIPATSLAAGQVANYSYKKIYRVTTNRGNLNMRTGAGTSYRVIMSIPKGTPVVKLGEKKVGSTTWYKIKTTHGVTGWSEVKSSKHRNYLTEGAYTKVSTHDSGLNVRKGPGTSYGLAPKGSIPKGKTVMATKLSGTWAYIPSYKGWSAIGYLTWLKKA